MILIYNCDKFAKISQSFDFTQCEFLSPNLRKLTFIYQILHILPTFMYLFITENFYLSYEYQVT